MQYLHWIGGLLHGDLGYSYVSEKPALDEILPRIPITARLAGLALLFSASIGIPLGVISAVKQGTRLDYVLRVVSLSGLSLPSFWLGLLILMASSPLFGTMPIYNPNPKTWTEAIAIYARAGDGGRLSQRRADHAASRAPRCWKSCGRTTSAPRAPRAPPRLRSTIATR